MYLDSGTILAIIILLVIQLAFIGYLVHSNYRLEQAYWNITRLLKIERQARDIRN